MVVGLGGFSKVAREGKGGKEGEWFDPGEEWGVSWGKEGGGRLMFVCEKETRGEVFEGFLGEVARGVWRAVNQVEGTMEEEEGVREVLESFGKGVVVDGAEVVKSPKKGRGVVEEEGKGKEKEEKSAWVMLDEIGDPPKGYCLEVRAHLYERVKKEVCFLVYFFIFSFFIFYFLFFIFYFLFFIFYFFFFLFSFFFFLFSFFFFLFSFFFFLFSFFFFLFFFFISLPFPFPFPFLFPFHSLPPPLLYSSGRRLLPSSL